MPGFAVSTHSYREFEKWSSYTYTDGWRYGFNDLYDSAKPYTYYCNVASRHNSIAAPAQGVSVGDELTQQLSDGDCLLNPYAVNVTLFGTTMNRLIG